MMNKTSSPDWMFTLECECALPLCPVCDPDFYRDLEWDLEQNFMPDDAIPPF